jgi:formate hydrogenlyase subunit 3/multisubunit Na+/H+ antiporter MnhD subunit
MRDQLVVLGEWFLCSILMFTLPFGSFFGSKYIVEQKYPNLIQDNLFLSTLIPVVCAILTVWAVIAAYCYLAWRDEFYNNKEEEKKDN